MKTRDLNDVRCIQNKDQRVLVEEEQIEKRLKSYFDKLFNKNTMRYWSLGNPMVNGGYKNHKLKSVLIKLSSFNFFHELK